MEGYLANPYVGVVIPLGLGFLSGVPSAQTVKQLWPHLVKPWFAPPRMAFPIVWTGLYVAMGYASSLIARAATTHSLSETRRLARWGLGLYGAQLFLNVIWMPTFWVARRFDLAMLNISSLWLTIAGTIGVFYKVDRKAAYWMLPYLGWVSLASALNWSIWKNNPEFNKGKQLTNKRN
ncbi:hypothetical protein BZG36_02033 [Bifiguratus adelaidae]|uniref:Translocator protein n=1 Tax=Bifiguratus adelaidae TaxID=1938954 RepID=A0A261Y1Z7_9FUNG|nr:hypothetical protein BZG36_02033 [Bifiguratus adelaidae]